VGKVVSIGYAPPAYVGVFTGFYFLISLETNGTFMTVLESGPVISSTLEEAVDLVLLAFKSYVKKNP
jgi:hypothetical protein